MKLQLIYTLILAVAFIIIFVLGEVILKLFKVKAEITRKTIHLCSGLLTMLFPVMLNNHWLVLILCGSFFVILIVSQFLGLLNSIHGVERITYGSMLFPIAVYVSYFIAEKMQNWLYFFIPIQIMAISDTMAAIIGQKFPYKSFKLLNHTKTISGSIAFLASAFTITTGLMIYFTFGSYITIIIIALIIASITTLVEAISHKGIDNLSIPLTALLLIFLIQQILH